MRKSEKRDTQTAGLGEESEEWQKVAAEISTAESRLDSYVNKRNEMESSGTDVQFAGGLANESMLKSMGAVAGETISSLRQKIGEIETAVSQAVGNIPVIGRVAKETAFLGQSAFEGFKIAVSGIASAAKKAASGLSGIASVISKLVSGIKGAAAKLSGLVKSMLGVGKSAKKMDASLTGGKFAVQAVGIVKDFAAGVSKSGGADGGVSPGDMFMTVPIEDKMKNLANGLKTCGLMLISMSWGSLSLKN